MGQVLIKLPDNLHKDLKRRAIDEDMSLKKLVEKALWEYLRRQLTGSKPEERGEL